MASVAKVVRSQLAEIGITVEVQVLDIAACTEQMKAGNFTLAISRGGIGVADCGSMSVFLLPDGSLNYSKYENDKMVELFQQGEVEMDLEKRKAIYQELGTILQTDLPVVSLYEFFDLMCVNADLNVDAGFGIGCDYEVYDFCWNESLRPEKGENGFPPFPTVMKAKYRHSKQEVTLCTDM